MTHLGFTGTRYGCTEPQFYRLRDLVDSYDGQELTVHHGDCVGADAQFHKLCAGRNWNIVGHIPSNKTLWANCAVDEARAPEPYERRNRFIVAAADAMIACPRESTEQSHGGTWQTVRLTRKAMKPLAIIWPDGSVTKERWV